MQNFQDVWILHLPEYNIIYTSIEDSKKRQGIKKDRGVQVSREETKEPGRRPESRRTTQEDSIKKMSIQKSIEDYKEGKYEKQSVRHRDLIETICKFLMT
ncbi:hypothetical protein T03_301 [Trichinella britovi]|uniref:Uncharacterized protein n=1 Tax=Trichinella britovi TaxID=45882 RepID=A0A0V1C7Q6_TRIBR|nr:hypothetical protein T03_301 [Trichinella britovi]